VQGVAIQANLEATLWPKTWVCSVVHPCRQRPEAHQISKLTIVSPKGNKVFKHSGNLSRFSLKCQNPLETLNRMHLSRQTILRWEIEIFCSVKCKDLTKTTCRGISACNRSNHLLNCNHHISTLRVRWWDKDRVVIAWCSNLNKHTKTFSNNSLRGIHSSNTSNILLPGMDLPHNIEIWAASLEAEMRTQWAQKIPWWLLMTKIKGHLDRQVVDFKVVIQESSCRLQEWTFCNKTPRRNLHHSELRKPTNLHSSLRLSPSQQILFLLIRSGTYHKLASRCPCRSISLHNPRSRTESNLGATRMPTRSLWTS